MGKKAMSKQELLEKRDEILADYHKTQKRSQKKPVLTKKEKKILGIGKDEGRATQSHIRMATSKAALVCDLVRGKDLAEAKAILTYTNRAAAPVVLKLLNSAEANAVNNNGLDSNQLYVAEISARPGPILKRWKAMGKGSASRINKRTCHITAVVRERA